MLELDAAILCTKATSDGMTIALEGIGTDTFLFGTFPGTGQLHLMVRVAGDDEDVGVERHLLVSVTDADDNLQSETMQPVVLGKRPSGMPHGWRLRAMQIFPLTFTFNEPGAFLVTVGIAGSEVSHGQPVFARQP